MAATELQFGTAKIFGIDGITITGVVTFTYESVGWEANADIEYLKNQNGDEETLIVSNQNTTIDIQFAPNGATRAAALTSLGTLTSKTIGAQITVASATTTVFNGTYNIQPGVSVRSTRDGITVASFKAKKGPNALALAS